MQEFEYRCVGTARRVARLDTELREQGGEGRREAGEGDGVDPGDSYSIRQEKVSIFDLLILHHSRCSHPRSVTDLLD